MGRAEELAAVAGSLSEQRLVTLTGVGGVGKSRLASEAVERLGHRGGMAVVRVDLWPLQNDKLLVPDVAHALGFASHSATDTLGALTRWLHDQDVLLVLEARLPHPRGPAPRRCPRPDRPDDQQGTARLAWRAHHRGGTPAARTDGAKLLRARAALLGTPLVSPEDVRTAVRLSRRLEGIPLAIELAAGQLADRTIEQVDRHLRSRSELTADHGDGPSRHRALRTTIGWSHELCEPAERLLWARLSVFRGDVTADTVQQVCAGGPLGAEALGAALAGLERKSVLSRRGNRYRLLDTLREYGSTWLDELGETATLSHRHAPTSWNRRAGPTRAGGTRTRHGGTGDWTTPTPTCGPRWTTGCRPPPGRPWRCAGSSASSGAAAATYRWPASTWRSLWRDAPHPHASGPGPCGRWGSPAC
ncbi:hypothetical protein O3S80_35610 [Streptomyces sp. Lzd4kr]|nr:hypothetical protein [Streptomyces sp. Lzd4kr]